MHAQTGTDKDRSADHDLLQNPHAYKQDESKGLTPDEYACVPCNSPLLLVCQEDAENVHFYT